MTRNRLRQRGFALLIVLWTLALLGLLGTQVLMTSRQDAQLVRNLLASATLEAAASGAVQQAIFHALDSTAAHWKADDVDHIIEIGTTRVAVRISNEADKINPGIASPTLLQSLLLQVGANPVTAAALAASIAEWRLGSGPPTRRNGTFLRYQRAGREYAPSGAPLADIDELGSVIGMTADLLSRLRPHLTVYTDDDPGPATRDPVVARALASADQLTSEPTDAGMELLSVTADARGPDHGRLVVHAIARTNALPRGRRFEILTFERLWD